MRILSPTTTASTAPASRRSRAWPREFGEVRIVAPDVEQSSAGHAITASRPLSYRPHRHAEDFEAFRVNGTPADCVALGVLPLGEGRRRAVRHQPRATSATRSGTRARSRRRSRRRCSACAGSR